MKIYFTRHGESVANTLRIISNRDLPHPLTEKGRQQANALGHRLRGKSITRIYTSPILRAKETAEILSSMLKVPMVCEDALREPDCGILEGRGDEVVWMELNYWMKNWCGGCFQDRGPQGGETFQEVRKRLVEFIGAMIALYEKTDSEFLMVTHGALILYGLPGICTGVDAQFILEHGPEHATLITTEVENGRLKWLEWENGFTSKKNGVAGDEIRSL